MSFQLDVRFVIEQAQVAARKRLPRAAHVTDSIITRDFEIWINRLQREHYEGTLKGADVTRAKAVYRHYYQEILNPSGEGP